jgi:regulator of RNase E activity RraA
MRLWQTDDELFALAKRELFTGVVGDVMDQLGLQRQFLPPYLQPLRDDMVVIGRAMPVLEADVFGTTVENTNNEVLSKPFGLMLHALDSLKPSDVYICTGGSPNYALWGGLMSTRALKLRAAGAVLDGYTRDTREILALNFPTFSRGRYAQDQGPRGKVIDFNVPIVIGQAQVRPGDIVFGDLDGVCIVPAEANDDVFQRAIDKVRGEQLVRDALEAGMSTVEAFEKYGIM